MKRKFKRIASLVLAMVMVFAMAMPAMTVGAAGEASIKIEGTDAAPVKGRTFNAYQILEATVSGDNYAYQIPAGMEGFYQGLIAGEKFEPKNLPEGTKVAQYISKYGTDNAAWMQDFAKKALAAAKEAKITPKSVTATPDATYVTIEGLNYGYYVVEDASVQTGDNIVSALMLDTAAPNADVTLKGEKPTIDKFIDEANGNTTVDGTGKGLTNKEDDVKADQKNIGDTVNYVIEGKVPDMTGYETYLYELNDDVTEGLDITADSFHVFVGGTELSKGEAGTKGTYTLDLRQREDSTYSGFTLTINGFIDYKENVDAQILVKYSAVLNENAKLGKESNDNTVDLTYSNNPNQSGAGDNGEPKDSNPKGETPDSVTRTYSSGLKLTKIDGNSGKALAGAEFTISGTKTEFVIVEEDKFVLNPDAVTPYYKLKDGTYTTDEPTDETADKYDTPENKYELKHEKTQQKVTGDVSGRLTVSDDGVLSFVGLGEGDYTITEVKAPDGYNMLKDPIRITIKWNGEDTDPMWECTSKNATYNSATGLFEFNVNNYTGAELPETGGIGTTIFYVVGSILVLAAVILLVTKKRMHAD